MRHSRHMRYTKADPPRSADAGLSDALELLVAADDPKAAAHGYRQTATSGHPIGLKFGTPMTDFEVQRP